MVVLILVVLCLFIFYPVLTFYRDEERNDVFPFSFMLKPYVSQDGPLFSFK